MNQTQTISHRRQSFYAYLVTAWLMLGAFVCHVVFTPFCHFYLTHDFVGVMPLLVLLFPLFPFIGSVMGLISGGLCWKDGEYLLACVYFAAGGVFIPLWWGVWHVLYGKTQRWFV